MAGTSRVLSRLMFWRRNRPVVPVVRLAGVIASSGGLRRGLSLEAVEPQLKKAFSFRNAKAVALIINSPGGSPVQSSLIGQRIRQLAQKANVPVLAFCEDVAASGGYWLAAAADEIYANQASIIGSIGVVSAGFGFDRAIERIGIDRRVYTAGDNKMILDPFKPESEGDVNRLKSLQQDIHKQFIEYVVDRRGGKLTGDHDDLFSGAFWTGAKALELGLIDGFGDVRGVMRERYGENVKFRVHGPREGLLSRLGLRPKGLMSASEGEDLAAGWAESLLAGIEARAMWNRFGL